MRKDPIVEHDRKARAAFAAGHGNDINAMLVQLKENTSEHTTFMREITKLQKASAKLEKLEGRVSA